MSLTATRLTEFREFVKRFQERHQAPGIAVGLAIGDEVVLNEGFGYRDLAEQLPVTEDTVFGIASITKSFAALAIAQLVDKGLIAYDDSVTKYLPEFKVPTYPVADITIHHFLTHTAGIAPLPALGYAITANTVPDEDKDEEAEEKPIPAMDTYTDLLSFFASGEYQMFGPAGQYFSYSNDCYALLGAIVERVTGQPFDKYAQEHILDPLKMTRSTFFLEDLQGKFSDNTTVLYYKPKDEIKHSKNWQVAPPYLACGWLKTSATDLLSYFQMYAAKGSWKGHQLLSASGVKGMYSQRFPFALHSSYAYGLQVQPHNGVTLVEHGGALKGVSSRGGFVPEKKIAAVVLCNLSGVPVAELWLAAVNLALGLPLDTPRYIYETGEWAGVDLDRYVGTYLSGEGAQFDVLADNGELLVKIAEETYPLKKVTDTVGLARVNDQDTEIRFFFKEEQQPAWAIGHGVRIIPRGSDK